MRPWISRTASGVEPPGEHLANAIVIGLDAIRRAAAANEARGAKHHDERLPVARDPARVADDLGRHRPAADRQRLEEAARVRPAARSSRASNIAAKVGGWLVAAVGDAGVERQLLQHERAAARLARHAAACPRSVSVGVAGKQAADRASCASSSVIGSSDSADHSRRPARSSNAWRNGLAAISSLRKHSSVSIAGGLGGPSSSSSSTDAVRVGPLKIVDPDRRAIVGSRAGGAARQAPRTPDAGRAGDRRCSDSAVAAGAGHRVHLEQHGEHARQRRHIGRQQAFDVLERNRPEIAAQIVDDAIERLVGHRLVFVAAAGEHHDVVAPVELARESAGPARSCRCPRDRRRRRPCAPPLDDRVTRVAQRLKLTMAADERRVVTSPSGVAAVDWRRVARQRATAPRRRSAAARDRDAAVPCRWRSDPAGTSSGATSAAPADPMCALRSSTSATEPSNGSGPGQRLVERHADAVPIARLGRRARRTPPRATCTRAFRRAHAGVVPAGARRQRFGDQAEVENHDAPFGRDQHVRRLDVAMQLASPMQRRDAVDRAAGAPRRADRRTGWLDPVRARSRRSSRPRRAPS